MTNRPQFKEAIKKYSKLLIAKRLNVPATLSNCHSHNGYSVARVHFMTLDTLDNRCHGPWHQKIEFVEQYRELHFRPSLQEQ